MLSKTPIYSYDSTVNEKPSPNKITLIFDLDETFITQIDPSRYGIYMSFGVHRFSLLKYKMLNYNYINGSKGEKYNDKTELIALRPELHQFIDFLIENLKYFNIGFWTTCYHRRAKAIVDLLFPQFKKYIVLFIARDMEEYKVKEYVKQRDSYYLDKSEHPIFYDVLKKKKIHLPAYLNGAIVKRVDLLCELPEYSKILNKNRTILIDDFNNNIIVNHPKNTIWVNPWDYRITCDNTLKKLKSWLDKNKKKKSFANVKMPNYAKNSIFNPIIVEQRNPLERTVEIQKTCNSFYEKLNEKTGKTDAKTKKRRQIEHKLKKVMNLKTKKAKKAIHGKKSEPHKAKKSKKATKH